jgi:hypothetical protein
MFGEQQQLMQVALSELKLSQLSPTTQQTQTGKHTKYGCLKATNHFPQQEHKYGIFN